MFSTPARRIYSITLIAVTLFALLGTFSPTQKSGAADKPSNRIVSTTRVSHHSNSAKTVSQTVPKRSVAPKWYLPLESLNYQSTIHCILLTESVSTETHPNLGDVDPYQYGPFQFGPLLWNRWSWAAGVGSKTIYWTPHSIALNAVTIPAHKATLYEQAKVFAYVARHDGLWPWTNSDGCA